MGENVLLYMEGGETNEESLCYSSPRSTPRLWYNGMSPQQPEKAIMILVLLVT